MPNSKWGTFRWGQVKWGQQDATIQFGTTHAWDDTVLLIDGSSDANEDLSQFATDLTSRAESNSTRAAISGTGTGREVLWRGQLDNTTFGTTTTLVGAVDGATESWSLVWDETDFYVMVNNVKLTQSEIATSIVDGTADDVSVMWTTRPNPDTASSANACISTLLVYNHDDSAEERVTFTHAASTFSGSEELSYAQDAAASVGWVRLGMAWHDPIDFYEEWVSSRAASTSQVLTRSEPILYAQSDGIGGAGEFFGQAHHAMAAHVAREVDLRLTSPLVNDAYASPTTRTPTTTASPWVRYAPGSSEYLMHLDLARWVALPPNCDRARCRVQIRTYATDASTPTIGVRVYCMTALPNNPWLFGQPNLEYTFAGSTITADHTSTTGAMLDLGTLDLVRSKSALPGWRDSCILVVAIASEPGGTPDTNDRVEIGAVHIMPEKRALDGQGPPQELQLP